MEAKGCCETPPRNLLETLAVCHGSTPTNGGWDATPGLPPRPAASMAGQQSSVIVKEPLQVRATNSQPAADILDHI